MTCVRCGHPYTSEYIYGFGEKLCFRCVIAELRALREFKAKHASEPTMSPIPRNGSHMTTDQFALMSRTGFLFACDGHGFMATKYEMSDVPAVPCEAMDKRFSHVVWIRGRVRITKKTSKEILDNTSNVETLNKDSIN